MVRVTIDGMEVTADNCMYSESFLRKVNQKAKDLKLPEGQVPGEIVYQMVTEEADYAELLHMQKWCVDMEYYESAAEFEELMIDRGFINKSKG